MKITSLLINFKSPRALLTFPRRINKQTKMQASLPKYELHKLYEYIGIGFKTISLIAYLILVISGIIIFISLYKMVKERSFDLALFRTYGASNFQLIKGNYVHKSAIVDWDNITIGVENIFGPMAIIGASAQHKYYESSGKIHIGNKNVFSEFCLISRPTLMTKKTIIADGNYFMSNSVIHHDCKIENDAIICSNVSIAGNVRLMNGVYLGQNSSVHQFQIIGSYSLLGMNSCVTKKTQNTDLQQYSATQL